MSFKKYISARRVTQTPSGDFISDAKKDREFPDAASWEALEHYLFNKNACNEAVSAGREVWKAYEAHQRHADNS